MKKGDLVLLGNRVCIVKSEVNAFWITLLLPRGTKVTVHRNAVRLLDESR